MFMELCIALVGIIILAILVVWQFSRATIKTIGMNANLENQRSTRKSFMPIVTVVLIASGVIILMLLGKLSESGGLSILSGIVGYVLGKSSESSI